MWILDLFTHYIIKLNIILFICIVKNILKYDFNYLFVYFSNFYLFLTYFYL